MEISNIINTVKKWLRNSTLANMGIVVLTTLLAKGLGFLKDIVVAERIGLSELLDTFFIAVIFAFFIRGVFFGAFKSVFIPNYVSEQKSGGSISAFQGASFIITLATGVFFVIVSILITDTYLDTFFQGHTEQYYQLVKTQFYWIVPCIIIWGLSSLLQVLLNIDNEFAYSSLSVIFTPICILVCVWFFMDELGVIVIAFGTLVGSILSFLMLLIIALKRKVVHISAPNFKSKNIKILFGQIPAKLASGLLAGLVPLIDQYFSAQLEVGSISALNYGIKIPMLFMGIIGIAIGSVLLPYFSKKVVDSREDGFIELKKIIKYLLIGSLVIVAIFFFLSYPIISIIFERNEFTSEDTLVVSKIQQMYLFYIPSSIIGLVIVKFLTSINENNFMVLTSALTVILNFVLNYIFIQYMGVYGLALSTSVVSLISCLVLYYYVNRLFKTKTA